MNNPRFDRFIGILLIIIGLVAIVSNVLAIQMGVSNDLFPSLLGVGGIIMGIVFLVLVKKKFFDF